MKIFRPADILIPDCDMHKWSVVACDQFTSEPEYWQQVREIVGAAPSTLHMILPEAELGTKDPEAESVKINAVMQEYLDSGLFCRYPNSYIYLERTLKSGAVRRGIMGMFDLEAYDWAQGTHSPVRATEHTVEDRLPPRVKIRKNAPLEMPHIMIFMDDPENSVFSAVKKGEPVYDFELMQNGGRISGWLVEDNDAVEAAAEHLGDESELIKKYGSADNAIVFAMGDGNHSLAAAKRHWEQVKEALPEAERESCPARYALAELVNIHDEAITFEPIHKVVFDTRPESFVKEAREFFAAELGEGRSLDLVTGEGIERLNIAGLTIGQLIDRCEEFCKSYVERHGGYIDYIHGDCECIEMSQRFGCAGILLPRMEKSELFTSVMSGGPFPKKSFSIGHGNDKRYYLECRKIR